MNILLRCPVQRSAGPLLWLSTANAEVCVCVSVFALVSLCTGTMELVGWLVECYSEKKAPHCLYDLYVLLLS